MKVGDRVVCIGYGHWAHYGRAQQVPVRGGVYTIRWAGECAGQPSLRFHELVNAPYRWRDGFMECAFRIQNRDGTINFRPVVKRSTDISIFQRMLTPTGVQV